MKFTTTTTLALAALALSSLTCAAPTSGESNDSPKPRQSVAEQRAVARRYKRAPALPGLGSIVTAVGGLTDTGTNPSNPTSASATGQITALASGLLGPALRTLNLSPDQVTQIGTAVEGLLSPDQRALLASIVGKVTTPLSGLTGRQVNNDGQLTDAQDMSYYELSRIAAAQGGLADNLMPEGIASQPLQEFPISSLPNSINAGNMPYQHADIPSIPPYVYEGGFQPGNSLPYLGMPNTAIPEELPTGFLPGQAGVNPLLRPLGSSPMDATSETVANIPNLPGSIPASVYGAATNEVPPAGSLMPGGLPNQGLSLESSNESNGSSATPSQATQEDAPPLLIYPASQSGTAAATPLIAFPSSDATFTGAAVSSSPAIAMSSAIPVATTSAMADTPTGSVDASKQMNTAAAALPMSSNSASASSQTVTTSASV